MLATSPPQVTTYQKAIKVTVDGPREPRSKTRHHGFHPFHFGPRFAPDPLMGSLPFKLSGKCFFTEYYEHILTKDLVSKSINFIKNTVKYINIRERERIAQRLELSIYDLKYDIYIVFTYIFRSINHLWIFLCSASDYY